jgi:hypothetical protein
MQQQATLPIAVAEAALVAFCRRHRILRLSLFGSVLRQDFKPESDVDVLVEFEPAVRLSLFGLARVENELTDLLGRTADVHEARSLHQAIRDRVIRAARDLYVAA